MQALILAAGMGSRLRSVSRGQPKCLLEIAGQSIIRWQLTALRSAGINDVTVVAGYGADEIQAALRGTSVKVVRNSRYRETNVLTSWTLGSAIIYADHVFLHGDTIFEPALLERLLEKSTGDIVVTVDRHGCGEEEMKVLVDGDRVTRVSKDLPPATAFGEFTGVLLVRQTILSDLRAVAERLLLTENGPRLFFEAAVEEIIRMYPDTVRWVDVTGLRWREIDFPEDAAAAEAMFAHATSPRGAK